MIFRYHCCLHKKGISAVIIFKDDRKKQRLFGNKLFGGFYSQVVIRSSEQPKQQNNINTVSLCNSLYFQMVLAMVAL
jgi:hypothetical protein